MGWAGAGRAVAVSSSLVSSPVPPVPSYASDPVTSPPLSLSPVSTSNSHASCFPRFDIPCATLERSKRSGANSSSSESMASLLSQLACGQLGEAALPAEEDAASGSHARQLALNATGIACPPAAADSSGVSLAPLPLLLALAGLLGRHDSAGSNRCWAGREDAAGPAACGGTSTIAAWSSCFGAGAAAGADPVVAGPRRATSSPTLDHIAPRRMGIYLDPYVFLYERGGGRAFSRF